MLPTLTPDNAGDAGFLGPINPEACGKKHLLRWQVVHSSNAQAAQT